MNIAFLFSLLLSLSLITKARADELTNAQALCTSARSFTQQFQHSQKTAIQSEDYIQALLHFQGAIKAFEQIEPNNAYVDCLVDFAELLTSQRQFNDAINYYGIAQNLVREEIGDRRRSAEISLGMATYFLHLHNQALGATHAKEAEAACDYAGIDTAWCSARAKFALAEFRYQMKDYEGAITLFQHYLDTTNVFSSPISREREQDHHRLAQIRILYSQMILSNTASQTSIKQLETLRERIDCVDHTDVCGELNLALAFAAFASGQYDHALEFVNTSLQANEHRFTPPDYVGELARLYVDIQLAKKDLVQARVGVLGLLYIPIWTYGDLAENTITTANYYRTLNMPEAEMFWLKRSSGWLLNHARRLRFADHRLGKEYLAQHAHIYHRLSELLLQKNRLAEALDVLDLYKENRYLDSPGELNNVMRLVAHTAFEHDWMMRYHQRYEGVAGSCDNIDSHLQQLHNQVQQEKKSLCDVNQYQQELDLRFAALTTQFLDNFDEEMRETQHQDGTLDAVGQTIFRKKSLWAQRADSAFIEYLHSRDASYAILITPQSLQSFRLDIKQEQLQKLTQQHQLAIQYQLDTHPTAQALYDALVKPLDAAMRKQRIRDITLFPDSETNTLAFASLFDGKHYLVERYSLRTVSQVEQIERKHQASSAMISLFGNSAASARFPALPAVRQELDSLSQVFTKQGLSYQRQLDHAFTTPSFAQAVRERHRIIHIATHYRHSLDDAGASYFLSGDGGILSVQQIRALTDDYSFADMISLSACETDLNSHTQSGLHAEGIGTILLRRGAQSVLATKWQVHDTGSAMLMPRFYSAWLNGATKAAALQQAQLELLHLKSAKMMRNKALRGVEADHTKRIGIRQGVRQREFPYAHPYYWAGYVLLEH